MCFPAARGPGAGGESSCGAAAPGSRHAPFWPGCGPAVGAAAFQALAIVGRAAAHWFEALNRTGLNTTNCE